MTWVLFAELEWGTAVIIFIYILIIFGSIVLHELIHAFVIKLLGQQPVLAIQRGFLSAGILAGEFLPRHHYLLVTLTPLLSMTFIGGLLLLLLPLAIGQPLLVALLLNFPASTGDLLVAQRIHRYPHHTLFASKDVDIFAYLPEEEVISIE